MNAECRMQNAELRMGIWVFARPDEHPFGLGYSGIWVFEGPIQELDK